ncbi:acetyl-CoA synthetase-like protein [Trametes meyenii]|nr:acetyl-CoA synthetase-like protein [Trametes meyenii]
MATRNEIHTVHGDGGPLGPIPDDVTIPQFLFDSRGPVGGEAVRPSVWLIDDTTGREVTEDQVRARVWGIAKAMHIRWNLGEHDSFESFAPHYPIVIWATHRLGGIVTGANPSYTVEELVYQIRTSKASALFVHPDCLHVGLEAARITGIPDDRIILFDSIPGDPHATVDTPVAEGLAEPTRYVERRLGPGQGKQKLALLFFSSSTTGKPKAVMISHYSVIANVLQMRQYADRRDAGKPIEQRRYAPGDRVLGLLPLYHIYGIVVGLHFFIFTGATIVVAPRFNFESMLRSVQRYKIAHLALVPPIVILLCKHQAVKNYDLRSVKTTSSAAAPLSAELTLQLSRVLPNSAVGQGYGMTETCTAVTLPPIMTRMGTPGSAGVLIPGISLRIRKDDGTWGGYNEVGEIIVTGPSMANGYLDNAEETAQTFVDGWVHMGDVGYVNEEKELFVIDRIKPTGRVCTSNGACLSVAPAEPEGLLLDHPNIADVCVVGAPDEFSGKLPYAFVSLNPVPRARVAGDPAYENNLRQAILQYVADRKTQYKWLAGVSFIDAIPKNPSGKLLRRLLRDELNAALNNGDVQLATHRVYKDRAKF